MSEKRRAKPLAELARACFERRPDLRKKSYLLNDRPWDAYLDHGAKEIEGLRRRFPRERVERAWKCIVLHGDFRKPRHVVERLVEQVYRAHYSSMKVAWSWHDAKLGMLGLAHLYGLVSAEEIEAVSGHAADETAKNAAFAKAREAVLKRLWPNEQLDTLFVMLDEEDFWGHIPLRSGVLALGLRLVFHEYACQVVNVLRKLHRNTPYTFWLARGRVVDWDEAMVLKTLPNPDRPDPGQMPPPVPSDPQPPPTDDPAR